MLQVKSGLCVLVLVFLMFMADPTAALEQVASQQRRIDSLQVDPVSFIVFVRER